MLLTDRNAVIYGGAGTIGGAVAKAFAVQGARVHLAGRTLATLDAVADDIRAAGGRAETTVLDALSEAAVDSYVEHITSTAGSLDISFNLIGVDDVKAPRSSRCRWRTSNNRSSSRYAQPSSPREPLRGR